MTTWNQPTDMEDDDEMVTVHDPRPDEPRWERLEQDWPTESRPRYPAADYSISEPQPERVALLRKKPPTADEIRAEVIGRARDCIDAARRQLTEAAELLGLALPDYRSDFEPLVEQVEDWLSRVEARL